jgi:cation diffusion facilitator CzcD-associated flavoprotein CzcO
VGGGDSALDVAATAMEAGAAEVLVFIRAADFSRVNYWKAFTHPGHFLGFPSLPPEARLRLLNFLKAQQTPPAQGTIGRLTRFENLRLHFNSPVTGSAVASDQSLRVSTPHGQYHVDHLVFATGYAVDLSARKELASLAPHIRFWSDNPPPAADFALDGFPDLEGDFSFREKHPGAWPALRQVHLFTGAALMSLGKLTGDIPGIGWGAERLARGIAERLYAADLEQQFQRIREYGELEVEGHEWDRLRVDH